MVEKYLINSPDLFKSDLANEFQFIYTSLTNKMFFFTQNQLKNLNDDRVPKPLAIVIKDYLFASKQCSSTSSYCL